MPFISIRKEGPKNSKLHALKMLQRILSYQTICIYKWDLTFWIRRECRTWFSSVLAPHLRPLRRNFLNVLIHLKSTIIKYNLTDTFETSFCYEILTELPQWFIYKKLFISESHVTILAPECPWWKKFYFGVRASILRMNWMPTRKRKSWNFNL